MSILSPNRGEAATRVFYTVGTLRYDKRQLVALFFWLMWNDFSLMLIEQVNGLNGILMKDRGATFTQIAILTAIGGFVLPWINPCVSTWSDRCRTPWGRRRPFLLTAAPLFALFLGITPYMPDLHEYLARFPICESVLRHLPIDGGVLFIGTSSLFAGVFNSVVLAIFSYLYWDVVPETVMGRFQSLSKTATLLAGLIWSFFIYGLAEHHPKMVYTGTATFCLVIYMVSVWQIKEGEYPPPDTHKYGGAIGAIKTYFVECFSASYFLWIYLASLFYQMGNAGNWYQFNYLHYDLKLDLSTIGQTQGFANAITTVFGLLFGFLIGALTDRLKPVRLISWSVLLMALLVFASYFYVHDRATYLVSFCLFSIANFAFNVILGAFTIEVFPRDKLGQFCSAQAVSYQVLVSLLNPLFGMFFDWIHNNRVSFLWTAIFYTFSALTYVKIAYNWRRKNSTTSIPSDPNTPGLP